ncbi:MAG: PKD domain-containing protein [Chlorobi bacterium]|nr:PKD domain-containing protein [Chlorobiota bacterium]
MKRTFTFFAAFILAAITLMAQSPEKMSYQAVVRDANNDLIKDTQIGIQISILQSTSDGTVVYIETQTPTTNANGLATIEIGDGTVVSGDFSTIDWSVGPYFIKTETDIDDDGNYDIASTSQLLSVPYALYAKTAGDVTQTDLGDVLANGNDGNGKQVKNIADPTDAQDAATKSYVDALMDIMENNGLTVVDFSEDATSIDVGESVTFSGTSEIKPTTWAWDFGDGETSSEQNPTHTYTTAGTFTVSLTANNGTISRTKTKTDLITVKNEVTDIDGNTYQALTIGNQTWMAENLKVTHFPDGTEIPLVTGNDNWKALGDNNTDYAYCWYEDNKGTYEKYGALYTWAAIMYGASATNNNPSGVQGICPDGWHIPSDAEWDELTNYLGTSNAASKLAGDATLWTSGALTQDSDFGTTGFNALPGGYRSFDTGASDGISTNGNWWSTTDYINTGAYIQRFYYDRTDVYQGHDYKSSGFSVRCVKD